MAGRPIDAEAEVKKILVTGAAGFIGHATVCTLLDAGWVVVGIDSINDYYDTALKYARLHTTGIGEKDVEYGKMIGSSRYPEYRFMQLALEDKDAVTRLFREENFDVVCNLAAQAGVRYSLENPFAYADSNLTGFLSILEACRHADVPYLVYASSSSVYGENRSVPFRESDRVDNPVSLYAATKKANELMASAYSRLYGFSTVGLRFFTVYGPWGRPDMAPTLFLSAMFEGRPIKVFNNGNMKRDFTYIDDIVSGVVQVISSPKNDGSHTLYNIGRGKPVDLTEFIDLLEKYSGRKAQRNLLPIQPGDVPITWADTSCLERDFAYKPSTPVETGVAKFVEWYRDFYGE
jgi:UDP-glucuronate 4-epimerase